MVARRLEGGQRVLYHQGLCYVPKIFHFKLISKYHNDLLVGHFGIEKTRELIARKYYWPGLKKDVKSYIRECNVCLASKMVRHRPYGDFQSLLILTHQWKDLSIDFVTRLPILVDWKRDNYDSIIVIIDQLIKMIYYKLVKVTINARELAKVILDVVVRHHRLPDLIVSDRGSLFTSKFCSLLYYFFGIKRRLSNAFYPQTNGQTERKNSTIKAYH